MALTKAEIGDIRMMFRQALDKNTQVKILSDMYLVSKNQIINALTEEQRAQVSAKTRKNTFSTPQIRKAVVEDRKKGMTIVELSKKYGFGRGTICVWCKESEEK